MYFNGCYHFVVIHSTARAAPALERHLISVRLLGLVHEDVESLHYRELTDVLGDGLHLAGFRLLTLELPEPLVDLVLFHP